MTPLFSSRRFWLLILDVVASLLIFFVGKYAAVAIEDVKFLIGLLQPVFIMVIGAYTVDDVNTAKLAAAAGCK